MSTTSNAGIEQTELTEEQKKIVQDNYATEDISALTKRTFDDQQLDGRTWQGKLIKQFLAGENITVKTTKFVPGQKVVLTPEQKKQIETLTPTASSSIEVARLVFNNPTLRSLSREWRAVYAYIQEVYPDTVTVSEAPTEDPEYQVPATMQLLVGQLNEMVPTGDINKKLYNWGKMTISEERQVRALMSYIRTIGFKYNANQFQKKVERNLYVSTFFRFTHDKSDLTAEEVDQYVAAAAETVNIAQITKEVMDARVILEEMISGDKDSRGKFMGMIELINETRTKLDQSKKTLQALLEKLVGSRSKRLQDRDQRSGSILNLFEAWMKDEQKRSDLLDLGIKEHEADDREVGRISDMDDVTAIICGQTKEEAGKG